MTADLPQPAGALDAIALRRQQREDLINAYPNLQRWIEALGPTDIELLVATATGAGLEPMARRLGTTVTALEERRGELKEQWLLASTPDQ